MYQPDNTDLAILEILQDDGRATYSDIAELVHLSRVSVRERINTMKKEGVITGFTVVIDSRAYRKNASIFMEISVVPEKLDSVARKLAQMRETAIVSQQTGATGLHVHAYIDNVNMLADFLDDKIYTLDGVMSVNTSLLIRQYKTNVYLA